MVPAQGEPNVVPILEGAKITILGSVVWPLDSRVTMWRQSLAKGLV